MARVSLSPDSPTEMSAGGREREGGERTRRDGGVEVEAEAEEGVRDIDDVEETARPAYTGRNSWSGLPITAHETIVEAIQAGFKPNESHFLHEKLHTVFKYTIDNATKDYRLPVMQSTTAIMIPGTLKGINGVS